MGGPLFTGYKTISTHGTSQGVVPRFFLQMEALSSQAFQGERKKDFEKLLHQFLENNISDFTDFYDIYYKIRDTYTDYKEGLSNGKYFSVEDNGSTRHWNSYKKWDKKVKTYATFFILLNSVSTSTGVL